MSDTARESLYEVVVNDEGQYSIWFADQDPPTGWRRDGMRGAKEQCLAHIAATWTDMRPLSLRRRMEEQARPAG
jgi:MbtH protein